MAQENNPSENIGCLGALFIQKSRKERDSFVDEILTSVGYKVIHTRYINDDVLNDLE